MIGEEDSIYTYEYDDHYKILPAINNWANCENRIKDGKKVPDGFSYTSNNNPDWMTIETLNIGSINTEKIGQI